MIINKKSDNKNYIKHLLKPGYLYRIIGLCLCFILIFQSYPVFAADGSSEEIVEEEIVETQENVVSVEGEDEASEEIVASEEEETSEEIVEEVVQNISVELPTVSEADYSPLDFILDPYLLMPYAFPDDNTALEPGQNFYFHNTEGEYGHSHFSDTITINNNNTDPVLIIIKIHMTQVDGLSYVNYDVIDTIDEAAVCLAAIDEDSTFYINENGVISFVKTVSGSYSFKLSGRCSQSDKWKLITSTPKLTITWDIKPQIMNEVEKPVGNEEEVIIEEETGEQESIVEEPLAEPVENEIVTEPAVPEEESLPTEGEVPPVWEEDMEDVPMIDENISDADASIIIEGNIPENTYSDSEIVST